MRGQSLRAGTVPAWGLSLTCGRRSRTSPHPLDAPASIAELKRDAFRAILTQERGRLTHIDTLFAELEREVG